MQAKPSLQGPPSGHPYRTSATRPLTIARVRDGGIELVTALLLFVIGATGIAIGALQPTRVVEMAVGMLMVIASARMLLARMRGSAVPVEEAERY